MATEMLLRNVAPTLYISALQSAWKSRVQIYDPSLWLHREPEVDEKMMRDADIASAVTYRTQLVAGREWDIVPIEERSTGAKMAVMVVRELVSQIRDFGTARRLLAMAFLSGARYAELRTEERWMRIGDGKLRKWIVPIRLADMDKRRIRLVRVDDGKYDKRGNTHAKVRWEVWSVKGEDWYPIPDCDRKKIVRNVYMNDESSLGHGRGLRDSLGWWWYAKENVFAESLDAVERFAQGMLVAKIDGMRDANSGVPNPDVVRNWTAVLNDMRARHILVFDKEDEIEHVQMNASGWELLRTIREELRETIRALILGGTLNTGGSSSDTGSLARAKVHEDATAALVSFDRDVLEETLTEDMIGTVWDANRANLVDLGLAREPKPRLVIADEEQHDAAERASTAQVLASVGLPLAQSDLYEQTGFRRPEQGEPLLEAPAQPPLTPSPGGEEFSRGSEDGVHRMAEVLVEARDKDAWDALGLPDRYRAAYERARALCS